MLNILELVLFALWVNMLPFAAHLLFGHRFDTAVDGGIKLQDGHPLLGPNKTWRGVIISIAGGAAVAPLLGINWWLAALAALLAMIGDLTTSLIKRRLGHSSGKPVFLLDQFLEGLLPLVLLSYELGLPAWQGLTAFAIFVPVSHAASRYGYFVLYRPPVSNYPRIIHTTTRLREWRACHIPMARWQRWLNFENYVYYRVVMSLAFKALGMYDTGVRNTLAVKVNERTLAFPDLPKAFDGYRILLLTDLHLDGLPELTDVLIEQVKDLDIDLCLFGGDIRMEVYGPMAPSIRLLKKLVKHIRAPDGVYGVLGNHDCIELLPDLEESGVTMLVNDGTHINRDDDTIWLAGVDDPHYYRCADLEQAYDTVPTDAFNILLAHSPELYNKAPGYGTRLYLCGHTHGGQICLPGIGPVFTHSSAPRYHAAGEWRYQGMTGYTSTGAGASGIPLRFNCPGEIPLITLSRSSKQNS